MDSLIPTQKIKNKELIVKVLNSVALDCKENFHRSIAFFESY